jgi:hypothetical protein
MLFSRWSRRSVPSSSSSARRPTTRSKWSTSLGTEPFLAQTPFVSASTGSTSTLAQSGIRLRGDSGSQTWPRHFRQGRCAGQNRLWSSSATGIRVSFGCTICGVSGSELREEELPWACRPCTSSFQFAPDTSTKMTRGVDFNCCGLSLKEAKKRRRGDSSFCARERAA